MLFSFDFKSFEIATLRDLFIFLFPLYPLLFICSEILTRRLYFEHTLSIITLKQCFERSEHFLPYFITDLTLLMIRTVLTSYFSQCVFDKVDLILLKVLNLPLSTWEILPKVLFPPFLCQQYSSVLDEHKFCWTEVHTLVVYWKHHKYQNNNWNQFWKHRTIP